MSDDGPSPQANLSLCLPRMEPSSSSTSQPDGKDELRCNWDLFGKWLSPPEAALVVTDFMAKKSPQERAEWYQDPKRRRQEESSAFQHAYVWETFELFTLRQLRLKRCDEENDAALLWEEALADPTAKVIRLRDQYLLGRYEGAKKEVGNTDFCKSGMEQSMKLEDNDKLATFETLAEGAHAHENQVLSLASPTAGELHSPSLCGHNYMASEIALQRELATKMDAQMAEKAEAPEEKKQITIVAIAKKREPTLRARQRYLQSRRS